MTIAVIVAAVLAYLVVGVVVVALTFPPDELSTMADDIDGVMMTSLVVIAWPACFVMVSLGVCVGWTARKFRQKGDLAKAEVSANGFLE